MTRNSLRDGHSLDTRTVLQRVIESAKELAPGFRVVLPCVLAIENYGGNSVLPCIQKWLRSLLNVLHEVLRRLSWRHPGVHEPHQVRERMVAKDQIHFGGLALVMMDRIQ